ncbi:hypothetical protein [Arthrobacter sp. MAHUQ-56]
MKRRTATAVAALVLCLASCSQPEALPPADGGTYGTLDGLKSAVESAGFQCPDLVLHNSAKYSASSGSCSEVLSLAVYANDASLQSQLDFWKPVGQQAINVGRNWTVISEDPALIQKRLGGTVFRTGV